MKNPQTLKLLPILALASLFVKISGSTSLSPVLTGPDKAYIGTRVAFRCIASDSSPPVTYELMGDRDVLIATDVDFQGGQSVPFILKIAATSEGSYRCKASAGGSTGVSNSIKLTVVIPPSNTKVTSEPFPPVTYEGSHFVLSCNVTKGSHLSYTWFFNRKEVTASTSPFFHLTGNKLVIQKMTPEHAGTYSCMAWSRVHDIRRISGSAEVQVTVKVYVSKPSIAFSVFKEGDSYHGNVTCWSTRGSLPVNFSLSLDDKEVGSVMATDSLAAWFSVVIVLGQDMGVARCRVNTEVQELTSEPMTLEVVPVEGDVKVEVEYLFRADSKLAAARLKCHVSRGTFPYISWLFNDSVLPSETHSDSHIQPVLSNYALVDQRRTLVLVKLGQEESGYYRCRVRDSYNDSGSWMESAAEWVQVTALITTVEAITIAFGIFLILMLALGVALICKMFGHEQARTHMATTNSSSEALPLSATTFTDHDVQNQTIEITV